MRALLLYNPRAGRHQDQRLRVLRQVGEVLQSSGFAVEIEATEGPGTASAQAARATGRGIAVIFACGGDGTINEVLQGLCGSSTALAVLPMGSANVLCRELGLSVDPVSAAGQYLPGTPQTMAAGSVMMRGGPTRYFLSMAGAGPDGLLMYEMLGRTRQHWGRTLYYLHALRLLFSQDTNAFAIRYRLLGKTDWTREEAVCAMAIRVRDLGGIFRGVSRGPALYVPSLPLVLVRGPAVVSLPLWFLMNWLGLQRFNPLGKLVQVEEFVCEPIGERQVHAQMDGEWIGRLPMRVALVPEIVRLLMPNRRP